MVYVLLALVGVPLLALTFSATVYFLGLFWSRFETSGGGFGALFGKMLIIAVIYLGLNLLGVGGIIGLAVMGLGYKVVFGAGWVEALVVGIFGGLLALLVVIGVVAGLGAVGMVLH